MEEKMEEKPTVEEKKGKSPVIIIVAIVALCLIGVACYFVFGNKDNKEEPKDNDNTPIVEPTNKTDNGEKNEENVPDETEPTESEDVPVEPQMEEKEYTDQSYNNKLNNKSISVKVDYTLLEGIDSQGYPDKHFEYVIYINGKKVENIDGSIYSYSDGDVSESTIKNFISDKDIKVISDNKGKEYLLFDVDGGGYQDSSDVYVIDENAKVILNMHIPESVSILSLSGSGNEKYKFDEDYHWYKVNKDSINYLEIDGKEDEDEGYTVDKNTKLFEHSLTIEDGKVVDKKTNETFTVGETGGSALTRGVTIKK